MQLFLFADTEAASGEGASQGSKYSWRCGCVRGDRGVCEHRGRVAVHRALLRALSPRGCGQPCRPRFPGIPRPPRGLVRPRRPARGAGVAGPFPAGRGCGTAARPAEGGPPRRDGGGGGREAAGRPPHGTASSGRGAAAEPAADGRRRPPAERGARCLGELGAVRRRRAAVSLSLHGGDAGCCQPLWCDQVL